MALLHCRINGMFESTVHHIVIVDWMAYRKSWEFGREAVVYHSKYPISRVFTPVVEVAGVVVQGRSHYFLGNESPFLHGSVDLYMRILPNHIHTTMQKWALVTQEKMASSLDHNPCYLNYWSEHPQDRVFGAIHNSLSSKFSGFFIMPSNLRWPCDAPYSQTCHHFCNAIKPCHSNLHVLIKLERPYEIHTLNF